MATKKATSARFLCYVSQSITFETGGDKSGGYTNDPKDSGGETKWGISKRAHPQVNIQKLTYQQAVDIYKNEYWSDIYDYILSDAISFKLFDMGILSGKKLAVKKLQKAINACGKLIRVDGDFGNITLAATNTIKPEELYARYIKEYDTFFNKLVIRVKKNKRFLKGWLNRLYWKWEPGC